MGFALILPQYIRWHYSDGFRGIFDVAGDLVWFVYHFFSLPLLAKTLFSPWRRLKENQRTNIIEPSLLFGNLVINSIMRFVGFGVRIMTIGIGFVVILMLLVATVVVSVLWLCMPVALILLVLAGIRFILPL